MESHQLPASLTVKTPDFTSCLQGKNDERCVRSGSTQIEVRHSLMETFKSYFLLVCANGTPLLILNYLKHI